MIGTTGRAVKTASLSTKGNLRIIEGLLKRKRPTRTLEIGFALGASALVFSDWHRGNHAIPLRQHTVIDPFQASVWDNCGVLNIASAGLDLYLRHFEEYSALALARLVKEGETFDLVYIDGSHLFEDVFVDFYFCARLLSDSGVILLDDSSDAHILKVVQFIRRNQGHAFKDLDLSGLRNSSGSWSEWKYRIGRALGRVQLTAFERTGNVPRDWDSRFIDF